MKQVLDKGYVRLVDYMGSDLNIVNSARVSYDKQVNELSPRDEKLIDFLAREGHTSPFRHAVMQFEIYAPLMVARQWWKYVIGGAHQMDAWNESSRRYVTEEPIFYVPDATEWRKVPENLKQGSGGFFTSEEGYINTFELNKLIDICLPQYQRALKRGVAPEQARLFLPAYGLYVRWYWTASLQSVAHFLNQRLADDAQFEIQQYAQAVYEYANEQFPIGINKLVEESR